MAALKSSPLTYCSNLVRKLDFEGYIATMFYPKQARSAAIVVRAFNLELAQAFNASRDRKVVDARLQFWSDAVKTICRSSKDGLDQIPTTPVCYALATYMSEKKLPEYWLKRLVKAREKSSHHFETMEDLIQYGEDTQSTLNYILLNILGVKEMSGDMGAKHLGKAVTITNFIRSAPNYVRLGVAPIIPSSLFEKHKISYKTLMKGQIDSSTRTAIFEMAAAAIENFEMARDLKKKMRKEARLIYLPADPVERYLYQLRDVYFNPFDVRLLRQEAKKNSLLPIRMMIQNFKNKRL